MWRHRRKGAVHWAAPLCCVGEGEKRKAGGEMREKTNLGPRDKAIYNSAGCLAGGPPV